MSDFGGELIYIAAHQVFLDDLQFVLVLVMLLLFLYYKCITVLEGVLSTAIEVFHDL